MRQYHLLCSHVNCVFLCTGTRQIYLFLDAEMCHWSNRAVLIFWSCQPWPSWRAVLLDFWEFFNWQSCCNGYTSVCFFFFFPDRLGGRIPVLQDIWPGLTYSNQEIVLFCVSVIMGDHSRHGIAVYHLYVSRGIPVCYNKILDVCIVTESKKHGQLQESFYFYQKKKKKERKHREKEK